jgi:cysteine desulfurase
MQTPVYLDHNATTPVDERVLEAMLPYLREQYGNPSSSHVFGERAAAAVDRAAGQLAELLGAEPAEIVFTSGASEANNLALKGVVEAYASQGNHVVTCATEHKAVLEPLRHLQKLGRIELTVLEPDPDGRCPADRLAEALTEKTILVSLMLANNETGVIHPLEEISRVTRQRGVLLHTDATQALGKREVNVDSLGADLLSLSAHKAYGPKGSGALYVRGRSPRVRLAAQIDGGGQQKRRRSGTLNVPGIVGLGAAAEICALRLADDAPRQAALRDRLEATLFDRLDHVHRNGSREHRLCNTANVSFDYVEGEAMMMKLHDLAVSSGSACASDDLGASHVLLAMGVDEARAHGSLRISVGRRTTAEEIDFAAERIVETVNQLREMSVLYEMAQAGIDPSQVRWKGH